MSWRRFFGRARADAEHAREFQSFIEMETEENIARGMSPEAARHAACLKFGNPTAIRQEVYEMNRIPFLETLARDARYAVRVLKGTPTFAVVSLLTLALGIGATTAIFTVVNSVILRPLSYPDPDRLVTAWETNAAYHLPGHPSGAVAFSPGNYLDLRDHSNSFAHIGGFTTSTYNLSGGNMPDRITGGLISADLVAALAIQPAMGRLFVRSDDSAGAERVAILSHSFWRDHFGGNPSIVGTSVKLDERSHIVIGVMPASFQLANDVDIWLPLERKLSPEAMQWRQSYYLRVIGRLKPGVSVEQARQDVDRVVQAIRRDHPGGLGNGGMVVPLLSNTVAAARGPLFILLGAVGFVLLIACANVANLNLGRAIARRREIAVRLALGASRSQVIRQLFTESLLLALTGAGIGVGIAEWGIRALLKLAPTELPRAAEIHIDAWVLGFTTVAAAVSAVAFGLLPAISASKTDPQDDLRGGRSTSAGPGTQTARRGLVISEIAIALMLMIGAGLMIESFRRVSAVDPGFDSRGVITMRVALSAERYDTLDRQNGFYQRVIDRLREIPGLRSASAIDGLPFSNGGFDNSISIPGRAEVPGQLLKADIRRIDSGYFEAMRIALLEGRSFAANDRTDAPPVVIVSRSMARKYWPGESAVGRQININFGPPEGIRAEIVGVAADVRSALDSIPGDYIYMHYPQGRHIGQMDLVLRQDERQRGSVAQMAQAVRDVVSSVDPDQPVYRIRSMDQFLRLSLATRKFEMLLLGIFAAFAGCLAAIGLYGVLAYTVQSQTREIGIRSALGATRAQVHAMILSEGLKLAAIGLAVGIAAAIALTRVLATLLFEVRPTDPATFGVVCLLLIVVAIVAGYLPARRAAKIDPMRALRHD